jgi:hypothetical protein
MSRLRRLDDGFERRVEKLIPQSWGVRGRAPWGGLIGGGVAYIAVSTVLWLVALVTDYDGTFPAISLSLGIVALLLGIVLNRRWHRRHDG